MADPRISRFLPPAMKQFTQPPPSSVPVSKPTSIPIQPKPPSSEVGIVTQLPSLHQQVQTQVYQDKPIGWTPVQEIREKEKEPSVLSWEYQTGQTQKPSTYYIVDKPKSPFVSKPQVVTETIGIGEYRGQLQQYQQMPGITLEQSKEVTQAIGATYDWHPKTTIIKKGRVNVSYEAVFPYAGAEKYYPYKSMLEKDPGRATALGWGWGGLGNIDIAYYQLTGQYDKKWEKQISQLARYMTAKETLASGDVVGFSGQYWSGYLTMPTTQIGLATAGGYAIGGVSKTLTAKGIVAKTIGGQLITHGAKIGAGIAFGTYAGYHVAEPVISRGDWGEAIGRGFITTASFAGGAIGYKSALGDSYQKVMMTKQQQPKFTKEFIKRVPSFYQTMQQKLPGLRATNFLTGEGVTTKPISFQSSTGRLLYQTGQRFASTKFFQNIYGWAAKGYVPAKTYVMYQQGKPTYEGGMRIQDVLWKKRGFFGDRSWIPKETAQRFYSYIGGSGKIQIDFPTSRTLSGGDIKITGAVEGKVVKFGRGWFSHKYFSSAIDKNISVFKPVSKVDPLGGLGSYKSGGVVDVYKDFGVSKQQYNLFGEMVESGYWVKPQPTTISRTGWGGTKTTGGIPEYVEGFGSRYQFSIPKSSGQWKTVPVGIVKDVTAVSSLSLRTPTVTTGVSGGSSLSSLFSYGKAMYVPVMPKFFPVVLPSVSSGVTSILSDMSKYTTRLPSVSYTPMIKQLKIPGISQIQVQGISSISLQTPIQTPVSLQIPISIQAQIQTPVVTTIQKAALIQTPVIIQTPSIKTPTIPVVKTPFNRFPYINLGGGVTKKGRRKELDIFGKGYRFRKWETLTLKQFLGGR